MKVSLPKNAEQQLIKPLAFNFVYVDTSILSLESQQHMDFTIP